MGLIWGGGGCCCRSFYYCINICYYCYRLTKEGLGISFPQPNARKRKHWFLKAELLASLTRREVISFCVWGRLEEIQLIAQQKWCGSKMVEVAAGGQNNCKYMKRGWGILAMRETEIKMTIRSHYTPPECQRLPQPRLGLNHCQHWRGEDVRKSIPAVGSINRHEDFGTPWQLHTQRLQTST